MLNFPQDFFQEEVREDFTVDVTMKTFWAAEMEVLREVSEICERHGLQWFCAYGTLLGAVRHQGFVPWDDDMDIWMLREDYNKFLEVAEEELPKGYVVQSPMTKEGYTEYHTIVLNAKSISIDQERLRKFHGCPFATGIDIFPLDYIPRDAEERQDLLEIVTLMAFIIATIKKEEWSEKDIEDITNGRNTVSEILNIEFKEEINIDNKKKLRSEIYKIMNYLVMSYGEEDGDELVMYMSYIRNPRRIFHKSYFADAVETPFEVFGVPVPVGYHEVLTRQYGDYMVRHRSGGNHDYPLYEKQVKALREAKDDFEGKCKRLEELLAEQRAKKC